jgi:hypothetical protein
LFRRSANPGSGALIQHRNVQENEMTSLPTTRAAALCALTLAAAAAVGAARAADVGVSITVSEPGVYGRIDIGRFPQPEVVLSQPVIVAPPRVRPVHPVEPVYLWVPPGHRKAWKSYCGRYGACGVPVMFVQDAWYDQHVHPQGKGHGKGHEKGHDKGKGHGKDRPSHHG